MERDCKAITKQHHFIGQKKFLFFCLFSILLLCTGCGTKEVSFCLPYGSLEAPSVNAGNDVFPFFAADLCVPDPQLDDENAREGYAALACDLTKESVAYSGGAYETMYPASITKLVTAYVALQEGNLEDTVVIGLKPSHITEAGAKLCHFQEGDTISLDDLLHVMLVYSGNDAAMAVAEHIAGTEEAFCEKMNEAMEELGAWDSHFTNSHGLHDENHYTTAYDIYLVLNRLVENPVFLSYVDDPSVTVTYHHFDGSPVTASFSSTNHYLSGETVPPKDIQVLGGKTGTTLAAGSCLTLYVGAGEEKGITVLLHSQTTDTLYQEMNDLLETLLEE